MNKLLIFLITLTTIGLGQQLNHTWGTNLGGNVVRSIPLLDTTAATTNYIYVDLNDYYMSDINPLVIDYDMDIGSGGDSTLDGTVKINSDRMYIGTFYVSFDNTGADAAGDSLGGIEITATPGVYTESAKQLSEADWGTPVEMEEVKQVGDYFAINNVYLHATKYKHYPPEVIRLGINAPATTRPGCDDSTAVYWDFVYPAIYHSEEAAKPKETQ